MKRRFISMGVAIIGLAATPLFASAQSALDVMVRQRNEFNTGWIDRFMSPPAPGIHGLMIVDGNTQRPNMVTLGSNLSISSGVLAASGAAGPAGADGAQGVQGIQGIQGVAGAAASQAWSDITGKPTTLAGYAITDSTTPAQLASALAGYATTTQLTNGLAAKLTVPAGSTAQYVRGDGTLAAFPAIPTATPFNFSAPAARTLALATQYQALDISKASITTISPSCTNASTLLAASACTMQVRQASATGLTCSNGTVSMTWTSTVPLGLVFSQTSGSPLQIHVPIGGYFVLCATAGTFTIAATEQSAG